MVSGGEEESKSLRESKKIILYYLTKHKSNWSLKGTPSLGLNQAAGQGVRAVEPLRKY